MTKPLHRSLLAAAIFIVVVIVAFFLLKTQTKSYSPEETVIYQQDDLELEVFYNRPYKKDRVIFGELVPYDEVWRTGANEATTFTTNQELLIDGSFLPAGKYTLWTIPGKRSWKIIFNSKMYAWGITPTKKASREPPYDVLTLEVPVTTSDKIIEQFTISFKEKNDFVLMIISWDKTAVSIPIISAKKRSAMALLLKNHLHSFNYYSSSNSKLRVTSILSLVARE